jgi:phenylacetate-CoA ligase
MGNTQTKLQKVLRALVANTFYTRKLSGCGIDATTTLDEFVARAPFTTKADLIADQAAHSPYGSNLSYPVERYICYSQTSATTGTPMRWLDTAESWAWMLGNWQYVYDAADVADDDRCFFAFSFGPFLGFWTAFEAAKARGCLCIPGGGMRSLARLQSIIDNRVTVLCCTPTYAIHLGQVASAENVDLSTANVRSIIVAGEPGGSIPATRDRVHALWPGAKLYDHYGMTEIGPVSYQCPDQAGRLHIIADAYLAEVIEPESGQATAAGDTGELVLTTLGREACPLLRYRTGDLVRAPDGSTCACGTEDPALDGGILSRVDDMVIVRGVNVYPGAIESVVRQFAEVAEYRVTVSGDSALRELCVEAEPGTDCRDPSDLQKRLGEALATSLNMRVDVRLVPVDSLPRFELKSKRWVICD